MSLQVRRVVTGHDASGRAVVKIDEIAKNVTSGRPGVASSVIWSTDTFPVVNEGDDDQGLRKTGTTLENGRCSAWFAPAGRHAAAASHQLDHYAVVMTGEIDMELDGETVTLKAGDVLVQRGTIHNWVNRGKEVAIVAFVLVAGSRSTAGGKTLPAVG